MRALYSFLRKLDVFGAEVGLKYEGQNKYTSRFGGFTTFLVGCVLTALLYQQCDQIYHRDIANVVYQQNYVDNPSRYDLTPDKFSFMIGLLNLTSSPYIDETIYTVKATFQYKAKVINSNSTISYNLVNIPLQMGPCEQSDFQMIELQDYFLQQSYQNFYCIKNKTNVYLQGQFDKDEFSVIIFQFLECVNQPNCKPQQERQLYLKQSKAEIYYTNRIVQLSNHQQPFKAIGQAQYYNIFYDYTLISNFIFSNTFVTDDDGLFVQSESSQKELRFMNDRQQLTSKSNNEIFKCSIYLNKDIEDTYYRSYKKVPEVLSQLGGSFQVLFFIGCFVLKPYNQLKLQKRLYKDIFSEEEGQNETNQGDNQLKKIEQKTKTKIKNKQQKQSTLTKSKEDNFGNNIKRDKGQKELNFNQYDSHQKVGESIQEEKEEQKDSFFVKYFKFLTSPASTKIKQQKNQIESMRSLKSIINTQIQLNKLKQIFDFDNLQSQIGSPNRSQFAVSSSKFQSQFNNGFKLTAEQLNQSPQLNQPQLSPSPQVTPLQKTLDRNQEKDSPSMTLIEKHSSAAFVIQPKASFQLNNLLDPQISNQPHQNILVSQIENQQKLQRRRSNTNNSSNLKMTKMDNQLFGLEIKQNIVQEPAVANQQNSSPSISDDLSKSEIQIKSEIELNEEPNIEYHSGSYIHNFQQFKSTQK